MKTHQAVDGQYLKKCILLNLSLILYGLVLRVRMDGAVPSVRLCLYGVRVDTFMVMLMDLIKIVHTMF